jgi:hypothetical protein
VCRRLGEPRPKLDIDLNPSRPGTGGRRRVSWLTAPGRCEYAVESLYLNRCGFTERTLHNGAAKLDGILHRQSFELVCYGWCVHSH